MSIGANFRVGTLKLTSQDMPRLERAVTGLRKSTTDGLLALRERDAAVRRLRAILLRKVEEAFVRG